jgi:hypothetical protein
MLIPIEFSVKCLVLTVLLREKESHHVMDEITSHFKRKKKKISVLYSLLTSTMAATNTSKSLKVVQLDGLVRHFTHFFLVQ